MKYFEKKAHKFFVNKILNNLDKIEITPGTCRYNFNCHKNAVHEAIINDDKFIIAGFYLAGTQPILHFTNFRQGKFIDNTLGVHALNHKHYIWKRIYKKDFNRIDLVFSELRKELRNELPWYLKLFSKYNC